MKNLKITRKGERAELDLNSVFYPENFVKMVIKDFKNIFDAEFKKKGERIEIKLKLKTNGIKTERATYDFINYLFAEVKNSQVNV